jgi:hypothetical protein
MHTYVHTYIEYVIQDKSMHHVCRYAPGHMFCESIIFSVCSFLVRLPMYVPRYVLNHATKPHMEQRIQGQCSDHEFLRFSANFRQIFGQFSAKIGVFLKKKQCNDILKQKLAAF